MTEIDEEKLHQDMVKRTADQLLKPVITGSAYLALSFRKEVLTQVVACIWEMLEEKPRYEVPNPDETVRLD